MKEKLYSFEDVIEILKEFKDDDFLTFEQKLFLVRFIEEHYGDNESTMIECLNLCKEKLDMKDSLKN